MITEPRRLTETRLEWQTQAGLVQVQGRGRRKNPHPRKSNRFKRSVSRARHVEALVVADTSMMAFHQDGDVETYLLTIMNMVSSLYLDPTIGNFINVVVVRIILMEEDDGEVSISREKTVSVPMFPTMTFVRPMVRKGRTVKNVWRISHTTAGCATDFFRAVCEGWFSGAYECCAKVDFSYRHGENVFLIHLLRNELTHCEFFVWNFSKDWTYPSTRTKPSTTFANGNRNWILATTRTPIIMT